MDRFYGVADDKQPIALSWRVVPDDDAPTQSGLSAGKLQQLLKEDKIMHTPANQQPSGYIFWTFKDKKNKNKLKLGLAAADDEAKKKVGILP